MNIKNVKFIINCKKLYKPLLTHTISMDNQIIILSSWHRHKAMTKFERQSYLRNRAYKKIAAFIIKQATEYQRLDNLLQDRKNCLNNISKKIQILEKESPDLETTKELEKKARQLEKEISFYTWYNYESIPRKYSEDLFKFKKHQFQGTGFESSYK